MVFQQKKQIVGVCTGNSGRSPVFELIGNNYLDIRGLQDEFQVLSAGTLVDVINSGAYSPQSMKRFVDRARTRGDIYTPKQQEKMDEALERALEGDEAALQVARGLFSHLVDVFHTEEVSHRTAAINQYSREGNELVSNDEFLRVEPIQFKPTLYPNCVAVITMDTRNRGVVEEMYDKEGIKLTPYIEVVSDVPGNPGGQISDSFGLTRKDYFRGFKQLLDQTPVAINSLTNVF